MKKTLVAIAALAAVGAASAQSNVTLSGKLGFAYQADKSGAGVKSNGLRVTDGDFVLSASEDLGGGLKAGASMAVQSRGRGTAIAGRDSYVYISGGFGEVKIGAVDAQYQTLLDLAVPLQGIGLDSGNTIDGGNSFVDMISYTTPSMGGFTASLMLADGNTLTTTVGGMNSTSTTYDSVQAGLAYSNGPLNAALEITSFGENASGTTLDSRFRISGNYSLGIVTIGAGFGSEKHTTYTSKETAFGVAAPVGPVTVGLGYARATNPGGAVGPTKSGWEAVADYALSKRTSVMVSYRSEDVNAASRATAFRTRLMHKF